MGKPIEVLTRIALDDVAVLDTDRTITGSDGAGFSSADDAAAGSGLPARLAASLFGIDEALSHVFIDANQVVLQRRGGWGEAALDRVEAEVCRFFVHYRD